MLALCRVRLSTAPTGSLCRLDVDEDDAASDNVPPIDVGLIV